MMTTPVRQTYRSWNSMCRKIETATDNLLQNDNELFDEDTGMRVVPEVSEAVHAAITTFTYRMVTADE